MIVAVPLRAYRCANPDCPSRGHQTVCWGDTTPGWRGGGYCHQCKMFTFVECDDSGQPCYMVRPRQK